MPSNSMRKNTSDASRQQRRLQRLTKDPDGPKMRRLDLLVSQETYTAFEEIMDDTNLRRREALDLLIGEFHNRLKAEAQANRSGGKPAEVAAQNKAKKRA